MARVKYLKSTLKEVVFQLRFPKIIKLMGDAPSEFQEQIMGKYPFYSVQKNETVVEINGQKQQINENNHCFINQTGKKKVNLTSSFIAVSTLEYDRWEAFKSEIEEVLSKFYSCYTIPGIQRVGLRYKNVVFRSKLGLSEEPWKELLDASVLGPLAIYDDITSYKTEFEIKNNNNCFTNRHFELVRERVTNELALLLDCDYYYSGFYQIKDVLICLDDLHNMSQSFIEESHKEMLLSAMQPQELTPWQTT